MRRSDLPRNPGPRPAAAARDTSRHAPSFMLDHATSPSRTSPLPSRAYTALGLALALALSACGGRSVPAGAQLTCTSSDECPPGWSCKDTLGRCVPPGAGDGAPPALVGAATIVPGTLRLGATAIVTFTVSTTLARPPEVRLGLDVPRALTLVEAGADQRWTFSLTPLGDEPQDRDVPVTVDLVDQGGNTSLGAALGTVRFDFRAPDVVPSTVRVEGSPARLGQAATVRFRVTEALAHTPDVVLAATDAGLSLVSVQDLDYVFSAPVPAGQAVDVTQDAVVRLEDPAGNTAGPLTLGTVRFDVTPPALDGPAELTTARSRPDDAGVTASAPRAREGDAVVIRFTTTETLPSTPVVTVRGEAVPGTLLSDRRWQFAWVVPPGAADGPAPVQATLVDAAGNQASLTLGTITVDDVPPSIVTANVTAPAPDGGVPALKEGEPLTFVFSTSEELATAPLVRLANRVLPSSACTLTDPVLRTWSCATTVTQANDPAGLRQVYLELEDMAGNAASASPAALLVRLDYSPPTLAGGALMRSPSWAPASDTVGNRLSFAAKDPWTDAQVSAQVVLIASEALSTTLPLTLVGTADAGAGLPPATLAFTASPVSPASPSTASFRHAFTGTEVDGTYALSVSWADALGNAGSVPVTSLPALVVANTPPASASAIDLTQVVSHRAPWGSTATNGAASFVVSGTLPNGGVGVERVMVLRDASGLASSRLGDAPVGAGGAFQVNAGALDLPVVYVAPLNAAGARGTPLAVTEVEWTAGLGGKVAGVSLPNPNALRLHPTLGAVLTSPQLPEGGSTPTVTTSAPQWAQAVGVRTTPDITTFAFDGVSGRILGLGAIASYTTTGSVTWTWTDQGWTPLAVDDPEGDGEPTVNLYTALNVAMVEDVARHTVLCLDANGTWLWMGNSWKLVASAVNSPRFQGSTLGFPLIGYDDARGVVVLFGGNIVDSWAGASSDTWEWNGTVWTKRTFAGVEGTNWPSRRLGANLAFDRARGVLVLYGGRYTTPNAGMGCNAPAVQGNGNWCEYADTWEYDGTTWRKITILDPGGDGNPAQGSFQFLTYDHGLARVVLMQRGGTLWRYSGSSWDVLASTDVAGDGNPPDVANAGYGPMVYDRARSRLVYTQGHGYKPSTWERLGTDWVQVAADPNAPGAWPTAGRYGDSLVADTARHRMVMFGGKVTNCDASGATDCNFVWEWNGGQWLQRTTAATTPAPPGRRRHGAVYDAARAKMLVFGGHADATTATCTTGGCSDTWVYDGATATWDRRCDGNDACTTSPSARTELALSWDSVRSVAVLFGGTSGGVNQNDTWEWNGSNWTKVNTAPPVNGTPPARTSASLGYDPVRRRTVLFGGSGSAGPLADTWEWNGSTWTQMTPTVSPPARSYGTLTWDDRRKRLLLSGGYTTSLALDSWEYDGTTWTQVPFAFSAWGGEPVTPTWWHGMAWDPDRGVHFRWGGLQTGTESGGWLDLGGASKPGQALSAWLPASGIADVDDVRWVSVQAQAGGNAGVLSGTTCAAANGAELVAFWDNAWRTLGVSNTAPVTTPGPLQWSSATDPAWSGLSPALLRQRLARGRDGTVSFGVRTASAVGCAPGLGGATAVNPQITVRYHRN